MSTITKDTFPVGTKVKVNGTSRYGHGRIATVESWDGHPGAGSATYKAQGKVPVRYDAGHGWGWDAYLPSELNLAVEVGDLVSSNAYGLSTGGSSRWVGCEVEEVSFDGVHIKGGGFLYNDDLRPFVKPEPVKALPAVGSKVRLTEVPHMDEFVGKAATVVSHEDSSWYSLDRVVTKLRVSVDGEGMEIYSRIYANGEEITESEAKGIVVKDALKDKGIEVGTLVVGTYPSGKPHKVKVTSILPEDAFPVRCEQGHLFLPKEVEVAPVEIKSNTISAGTIAINADSIMVGKIKPVEPFTKGDLLVVVRPSIFARLSKGTIVKYVGLYGNATDASMIDVEYISGDYDGETGSGWSTDRFVKYDPAKYDSDAKAVDLSEYIDAINDAVAEIAAVTA